MPTRALTALLALLEVISQHIVLSVCKSAVSEADLVAIPSN